MKILLINPPWFRLFGGGGAPAIPLGLCYISAYTNKKGFETYVYDADFSRKGRTSLSFCDMTNNQDMYKKILSDINDPVWLEIKKKIEDYKPDIVGVSVKTPSLKSALNIAKLCKEVSKKINVVFGGPHTSCMPKETAEFEDVDFVIYGEGEDTFLELIRNLESSKPRFDGIKGLIYKEKSGVKMNPPRPLMKNLDELPDPDREHIIDFDVYPKKGFGEIFAGRGCPYECIFCASKLIWGRSVRMRSPERVVEEMEQLYQKYKVDYFAIEDDTFTLDYDFVSKFCDLLISKKIPVNFTCETRVNLVTKQLIEKLKSAGCDSISLGVESGSDFTLKKIKKNITTQQIKDAFKVVREVGGVRINAFLMVGFPWETEKDMLETVEFGESLKAEHLVFSVVTPYPNTELYDICKKEYPHKLPKDIRWENVFHQGTELILVDMSPEDYVHFIKNLEKRFLNNTVKNRLKDPGFVVKRIKLYLRNPKKIVDDLKLVLSASK